MSKHIYKNSSFQFGLAVFLALGLFAGVILITGKSSLSFLSQASIKVSYTVSCNEQGFYYGCNYPYTEGQCFDFANKYYTSLGYTSVRPNCCVKQLDHLDCYVSANPGKYCTYDCLSQRECDGQHGTVKTGVCKEFGKVCCSTN